MFETAGQRVALRAVLVAVGGLFVSLGASASGSDLELGEILIAIGSAWGLGLGYAGLNYASPKVNPSVGNGSGS